LTTEGEELGGVLDGDEPVRRIAPPGLGESLGGALDLAVKASRQIRSTSIYCGLLVLALLGPPLVLLLAIIRDNGTAAAALGLIDPSQFAFDEPENGAATMLRLSLFGAAAGTFAVIIDGQILVTAMLGAVAAGRRLRLTDALRISRRAFWPVVAAAIVVGLLGRASDIAIELVARARTVSAAQAVLIAQIIAKPIVIAPFAYWMSGIVIGRVGPIETLRRSVRIAATRWRLAILIGTAATILSIIQVFALGAGLDLVARASDFLGLDISGTPIQAVLSGAVALSGVVAISSLVVTVAALVAAPQVFVFIRMTGATAGLDLDRVDATPGGQPTRLVTKAMIAVIALDAVAVLLGLFSLWSAVPASR
jgi:hypothetical protein